MNFNIFEGQTVTGVTHTTISRGRVLYRNGKLVDAISEERGKGRFVGRKPYSKYVYDRIINGRTSRDPLKQKVDREPYSGDVIQLPK